MRTTSATATAKPVSRKEMGVLAALSVAYLLLSYLLVGFKVDQLVLVALVNGLYLASSVTRKLITGFSIFIFYWVLFDYMKAFPNYWVSPVHIHSLYAAEKAVFGLQTPQGLLTPNEYWLQHSSPFLNVLTGLFYLTWVPVPLAFAVYLFFRSRRQFVYFALTFLLVNLLGFVIYYFYPAAPPWYVQQHGFQFIAQTPGNPAGLARFDNYFHLTVFGALYAKSSNVFAAMPSLHASYPVLVLYYGLRNRLGWLNLLFATVMVGIWFSAVYNAHHYVLDVLAGILCAGLGLLLFHWLLHHSRWCARGIGRLVAAIS